MKGWTEYCWNYMILAGIFLCLLERGGIAVEKNGALLEAILGSEVVVLQAREASGSCCIPDGSICASVRYLNALLL